MGFFCKTWSGIPDTYKGIVLFLICLLGTHFVWELTISGDEEEFAFVTFCGVDVNWVFDIAELWFADKTHAGLAVLGIDTQLTMTTVSFVNGRGCNIIAGCTAIKQFLMTAVILLCARGRFVHKLWYCAVALSLMVGYNIIRMIVLTYVVRDHPEMFEFMHVRVMKYIFYGLIFLVWLLWDEWLRKVLK